MQVRSLFRFLPLLIIAAGFVAFFASGASRYLSIEWLRENYAALQDFVAARFVLALTLYMAAYVVLTAFSLPGATAMSLAGGFLFGAGVGTAAVVVAATLGATAIFLAARSALGEALKSRAGGFIEKFEAGFNKNAFSYLLLLRLIPLFPFFIVNLAPAFTKIRTSTYVLATFIGIIPGAFAYVSAGRGLGAVFESGGEVTLTGLLTKPEILTPIAALSILALLPIFFRKLTARAGGTAA